MVDRPTLSRERILDAARRVLDDDGLDALTMRRLGRELDVWPMSLYRHFADKEALVSALVAESASLPEFAAGGGWQARLMRLLAGLRDRVRAQPSELRGRLAARALGPDLLDVTEAGLALLREGGLDADAAAARWLELLTYALGAAALPADPGRELHAAVAGAPAGSRPALEASVDALIERASSDAAFAAGLERLLAAP